MVATLPEIDIITEPQLVRTPFGDASYNLLNRSGKKPLLQVDRIHSRSTDYSKIHLKSSTIIKYTPREDTINIMLRPSETTGIGPFTSNKKKLIGVSANTHTSAFWSAELSGTVIHSLSVRRSLLAKHAFDIVDTSILEELGVLTLDAQKSALLVDKLEQLLKSTDSTQALDIRLTHFLLSICEIAHNHLESVTKKDSQQIIWHYLRNEDPQKLNAEMMMKESELTEHQLNHLFKKQMGLSPRQFISNYKLNCIRQELHDSGRKYTECVEAYGYQSPDQLYRAYRKLFSQEPPLNTH